MVPMRQIRPASGPNELPISDSARSRARTRSPSTPSEISMPTTLAIRCAWSPNRVSPMARSPVAMARPAVRCRTIREASPSSTSNRAHSRAPWSMVVASVCWLSRRSDQ